MGKDKAPAFQFYAEKFLHGTSDMTADQVGGYIRLLCHQWDKGGLPDDNKKLRKLSGVSLKNLGEILKKFQKDDDGFFRNSRLEKTRTEQQEYRALQSEKAKSRWKKPDAAASIRHMPKGMPNVCRNDALYSVSSTVPIPNTVESTSDNFKKLTSDQQLELGAMACKTTIEVFSAYAKDKAAKLIAAGFCEKYSAQAAARVMIEDFEKVRKDWEFKAKPKTRDDFYSDKDWQHYLKTQG